MPQVRCPQAPRTVKQQIEKMSVDTQATLGRMEGLSDCTICTSDGFEFPLHRAVLAHQSAVLGCDLKDHPFTVA